MLFLQSPTVDRCRRALAGCAILFSSCFVLAPRPCLATVTFDWVTVGDAGNPADTLIMDKGPAADLTTGYGSVGYEYRIADKHVTNTQWVEFLNTVDPDAAEVFNPSGNGLFNSNMTVSSIGNGTAYTGGIDVDLAAPSGAKYTVKGGQENYPATWINWDSGARFVNWLHNGQGSGDTENGVYDMSITTGAPPPRQADASFFIPSEDEFYKAAYYDPTKNGTGGYWQYGVRTDSDPASEAPAGGTTSANYATAAGSPGSADDTYWQSGSTFNDSIDHLTDVGAYTNAKSHYGLYDVDGLVYQYTEGIKQSPLGDDFPVYRGGAWFRSSEFTGAAYRNLYSFRDAVAYHWYGLRVAAAATSASGDFNGDGNYDCLDIDALVVEISTSTNNSAFDLTNDGNVDADDLAAWLVEGGANNPNATGGNPFLVGDANLDGSVNGQDFVIWNTHKFTATAAWCDGDFNADGNVNGQDFVAWNTNKFTSSDIVSPVPEPLGGIAPWLVALVAWRSYRATANGQRQTV